MYTDFLLSKLTKKEVEQFFTVNIKSHLESLKNPGIVFGTNLPKGDSSKKPLLVVFRHGQSQDNIKRIFSGWRDVSLTSIGHSQAEQLAPKLKDIKFDYHFTSDLKRSMDTLHIAMGGRKYTPIIDWRLRERSYGSFAGKNKITVSTQNLMLGALLRRSWEYAAPAGESAVMVYYRVLPFLKILEYVLRKEKKSAVICCSSNSMRAIRTYYENLTPDQAIDIENPTGQDYCLYNL